MKLPNKQILIAHAAHGLRRQNADACSRAKFGIMFQGESCVQDVDDEFYNRADAHIHLANDQVTKELGRGKVSASFMFGMSRYASYVSATSCKSKEEMISEKDEAVEYFVDQFRKAFIENYDDYIENFDKYMGKQNET